MSVPSKIILGFCVAELGGFILFVSSKYLPGGVFTALLAPPLFFFNFAVVLVWVVWDLIVEVNHRTWVNIGVVVVGLVGLVSGAWWWYVNVALATGPMP